MDYVGCFTGEPAGTTSAPSFMPVQWTLLEDMPGTGVLAVAMTPDLSRLAASDVQYAGEVSCGTKL